MPDPGPSSPIYRKRRGITIREVEQLTPTLVALKAIIRLLQKIVLKAHKR